MEYNFTSGIVRAIVAPLTAIVGPELLADKVINDFSGRVMRYGYGQIIDALDVPLGTLVFGSDGNMGVLARKSVESISKTDFAIKLIKDQKLFHQGPANVVYTMLPQHQPPIHDPLTSAILKARPWINGGVFGAVLRVGAYHLFTPEAERTGGGYFTNALIGFASGAAGMGMYKIFAKRGAISAFIVSAGLTLLVDFVLEKGLKSL